MKRRARAQIRVEYDQSLAAQRPDLLQELHPSRNPEMDPAQLGARSSQKLWWRCRACGHDWRAAVANRTQGGTGCPVCGLKRRARTQSQVEPERSLAVKHPDIADELHPSRNEGHRPYAARCEIQPEGVVALFHLRPHVENRRSDAHGRLRLPRLLQGTAPPRRVSTPM